SDPRVRTLNSVPRTSTVRPGVATSKCISSVFTTSKKASPVKVTDRCPSFIQSPFHTISELALSNTRLPSGNSMFRVSPIFVLYTRSCGIDSGQKTHTAHNKTNAAATFETHFQILYGRSGSV